MRRSMKKYVTAGTTFSVALGIGFVMQYGDALASRVGVDEPISGPESHTAQVVAVTTPVVGQAAPDAVQSRKAASREINLSALTDVQIDPDTPVMVVPTADDIAVTASKVAPAVTVAAPRKAPVCKPVMTAMAKPMAMVRLTLMNACSADAVVTIHHQGMMFNAITDDRGLLTVDVPALSRDALFIADFKTGAGAVASVAVPDLSNYDRAVLQWQGEDGVQLHALEFGAGYDDAGHIWAASTGALTDALSGAGGFLSALGNPAVSDGLKAEVYTYPSGQNARDGDVVLNVEAEVTPRNCGREVAAQSIQIAPRQTAKAIDLTMMMPSCDAVGEFLVLKNMFADLTLAAK